MTLWLSLPRRCRGESQARSQSQHRKRITSWQNRVISFVSPHKFNCLRFFLISRMKIELILQQRRPELGPTKKTLTRTGREKRGAPVTGTEGKASSLSTACELICWRTWRSRSRSRSRSTLKHIAICMLLNIHDVSDHNKQCVRHMKVGGVSDWVEWNNSTLVSWSYLTRELDNHEYSKSWEVVVVGAKHWNNDWRLYPLLGIKT